MEKKKTTLRRVAKAKESIAFEWLKRWHGKKDIKRVVSTKDKRDSWLYGQDAGKNSIKRYLRGWGRLLVIALLVIPSVSFADLKGRYDRSSSDSGAVFIIEYLYSVESDYFNGEDGSFMGNIASNAIRACQDASCDTFLSSTDSLSTGQKVYFYNPNIAEHFSAIFYGNGGFRDFSEHFLSKPEISVRSYTYPPFEIEDGNTIPYVEDNTDFGSVEIGENVKTHLFGIRNLGKGDLNLSTSIVTISGTHASDFNISIEYTEYNQREDGNLSESSTRVVLPSGHKLAFSVYFKPSAIGLRTARLSIESNDSNENPFDFTIQGRGVPAGWTDLGNDFYLESNGVTVNCDSVRVDSNSTIEHNGKIYTKIDSNQDLIEVNATTGRVAASHACTSGVRSMKKWFLNNQDFNTAIAHWDTSLVTNMEGVFSHANSFNQDISNWNTSKVTTMREMFYSAHAFNKPIGDWNTSSVTDMVDIFKFASSFNQSISNWDISGLTKMIGMFQGARAFNKPIGDWNTSNITQMSGLFDGAEAFNQNIGKWDTSKVFTMMYMFQGATGFNQAIGDWNTSTVSNMNYMFKGATAFNQPISDWNTSRVVAMDNMFQDATAFNQCLTSWDVERFTKKPLYFDDGSGFANNDSKQPNWGDSSEVCVAQSPSTTSAPIYVPTPTYTLSGYVWIDSNQNGIKDVDESNLSDGLMRVSLIQGSYIRGSKKVVAGHYSFGDLKSGDYRLYFRSNDVFATNEAQSVKFHEHNVSLRSDTVYNLGLYSHSGAKSCTDEETPAYDPVSGTEHIFDSNCSVSENWIIGQAPDFDKDGLNDIIDPDDDNDGIDDINESYNKMNPFDASDALQDFDGDCARNLDEIHGGTDIYDSESRPTTALARNDFDGDCASDIFWRSDEVDHWSSLWSMDGLERIGYTGIHNIRSSEWIPKSGGDFNGDNKTDIFWYNTRTGQSLVWLMNGDRVIQEESLPTVGDTNWKPKAVGKFNQSSSDVLWRNEKTGAYLVWHMDGKEKSEAEILGYESLHWSIKTVADIDGNGYDDILWRNNQGYNYVWFMKEGKKVSASHLLRVADRNWDMQSSGDFNKDGKDDILWKNRKTGHVVVWLMDGKKRTSYSLIGREAPSWNMK